MEKSLKISYVNRDSGGYAMLDGETPIAKKVNEMLGDYWVRTGRELDIVDTILQVLADDYNERHKLLA